MINFDLTDLLLGVVSLLLAVSTFLNNKRKDNQQDGVRSGVVTNELSNIKSLLEEVRNETREIRASVRDHGERITRCEERMESVLLRIKRIEKHIDIAHE